MATESSTDPQQVVAAAVQRVGELFVGVCVAPDDPEVSRQANQALRELEALLA
jgi:cell division GTPase FtsZ